MSNREIDLTKPSLTGLSYLLRNNGLWPIGFKWDFRACDTCACGLASEYWDIEMVTGHAFATQTFGIEQPDALDVFYGQGPWYPKYGLTGLSALVWGPKGHTIMSKVTPDMVADAIDDYMLRQTVDNSEVTPVAVRGDTGRGLRHALTCGAA